MTETKISFEDTLNAQQLKAAQFKGQHLLVLAGAGTGKTRTIIARASHLLKSGVPEHRILILSFTRKSAREIVERIKMQMQNITSGALKGQTFHSWCMELIKSHPQVFAQSDYTLLDEEDARSCMKLICGTSAKDRSGHTVSPAKIYDIYSYCMNTRAPLSEVMRLKLYEGSKKDDEKIQRLIAQNKPVYEAFITQYIQHKRERRYIDYDDVLSVVARGLKNNPQAREFIASKYDHILIDEMQDTNPLQYELLSNFYDHCHLFCVGDDAQSIYAFRGADFTTIHRFADVVPNAQVQRLTLNYRSTQEILDLSNWLIQKSPLRYDKQLKAVRGKGKIPTIVHWDSDWEEANNVTDRILQSKNDHGRTWREHMVLARAGAALKKVEGACIQKGIPYVIYGGLGLMQSKHVRDLMSAMRIIANPHDELAWMRFLELFPGIGHAKASRLAIIGIGSANLDAAINSLSKQKIAPEITQTLSGMAACNDSAAKALDRGLMTMEPIFQNIYKTEWETRRKDFPILIEIARNSNSITEFVTEYVLDPRLEQLTKEGATPNADRVILTTIHSAKGLEATVCHLISASPGAWPNCRALDAGEDAVEEERRCLYVALTRAKDELWLYRPVTAIHAVSSHFKPLSPKIPKHVRDKIEAKRAEKWADADDTTYFFNHLPEHLYQTEVLQTAQAILAVPYTGPRIDIIDDFNFD
ncbi:MAG: ATP-dependent helicase [Proteobacteria bacterium]|nr:ATP-dependent helicase [Pseudomonadota bacterium]